MKPTIPALFAAVLFTLGGCTQETTSESAAGGEQQRALGPTNVATVNGDRLAESVFRLHSMNSLQRNVDQLSDEEYDRLLNDLIQIKLLAQEAQRRGLLEERTIAAQLELQRMQLIARSMAVRYIEENPPTEAELRAAYEENLPRYLATQYKARHILLETEDEATEVISQLDDGGDFAELAREHSTGPTASAGGDLGYFTANSMVPPFAEAVTNIEPGSYSTEPVQTQFGWHVIMVEDIKQQEAPGVDAVRTELQREVDRQKLEAFVGSLREEGTIDLGENR